MMLSAAAVAQTSAAGPISAGRFHTCALDTTGDISCWGDNSSGQLGDGSRLPSNVPVPVSGGLVFSSVVAGGRHTCGVAGAGVAYCWGSNEEGQLGASLTGEDSLTPVRVTGTFDPM